MSQGRVAYTVFTSSVLPASNDFLAVLTVCDHFTSEVEAIRFLSTVRGKLNDRASGGVLVPSYKEWAEHSPRLDDLRLELFQSPSPTEQGASSRFSVIRSPSRIFSSEQRPLSQSRPAPGSSGSSSSGEKRGGLRLGVAAWRRRRSNKVRRSGAAHSDPLEPIMFLFEFAFFRGLDSP